MPLRLRSRLLKSVNLLVLTRLCSEPTQIETMASGVAVYLPHQEVGVDLGRLLREQQIMREMTYQP